MTERLVASEHVGRGRIEVVVGDLTEQNVDAIVNAANSALAHGGGVAGAIVRKGGREIQAESDTKAPVQVGAAVATGAGRLPCRYVIHAVGPRWGEGDEQDKLRRAVHSALTVAEELGLESVAMPAISTGIFGYPKREGCTLIVQEAAARLCDARSGLRLVRLVSIDGETADHFATALTLVRKKC